MGWRNLGALVSLMLLASCGGDDKEASTTAAWITPDSSDNTTVSRAGMPDSAIRNNTGGMINQAIKAKDAARDRLGDPNNTDDNPKEGSAGSTDPVKPVKDPPENPKGGQGKYNKP